jgi:2-amino-4-hydroxy-6-hydroxymethyldihydropteridine diphosphokinase
MCSASEVTAQEPSAMEIGLSLGSNLGHRLRNLQSARKRIGALPATRLIAQSPVYETEPVDVPHRYRDKPFLNAVLMIGSELPLDALASALHAIEASIGRIRTADRNAPRPIDVDILYAGRLRRRDRRLSLPHPRWQDRAFVVRPLADVRPDLRLPGSRRTVREVLLSLPGEPAVVLYRRQW